MRIKHVLWIGVTAVGLFLAGFAAWILLLPATPKADGARPMAMGEHDATLAALRFRMTPKRERPLIAIVGINDATETTGYLMPYGILRRANVADVVALATAPGPLKLYPALTVEPDATVADFDAKHPDGADFVIVPALSRDDDPAVLAWLKSQATKGATVIGLCAGAKVIGRAGLLVGRRATTHWYYANELRDENPRVFYVTDRRFVVDESVATSTGITASMPVSLMLIEAIAGRKKADEVAKSLGMRDWDTRHDSSAFRITRPVVLTALGNTLAFWKREEFGITLVPGVDEVSLALAADAWSRTYRSRVVTLSSSPGAFETKSGIRVVPDQLLGGWPADRLLPSVMDRPPAHVLDDVLARISLRYGEQTARLVAMQLEYPLQSDNRLRASR